MSDPTAMMPRTDEADAEVELSTQELLALSSSSKQSETPPPSPQLASATVASHEPAISKPAMKPGLSGSRLPLSVIAIVAIAGATHVLAPSNRTKPATPDASQPSAQGAQPAPEQTAAGEPVRFSNPFDKDEVFEFPAGTSETAARDAVAEVLLQRAISRQSS